MNRQSPKSIITGFQQAWNAHDAHALAELFVEDAHFVNVTGLWWSNRAQIRQAHQFGFDHIFGQSHMSVGRTEIRMLGEDHAVVHARVTVTGQNTPMGRPPVTGARSSFVVTRLTDEHGPYWREPSRLRTQMSYPVDPRHTSTRPRGNLQFATALAPSM